MGSVSPGVNYFIIGNGRMARHFSHYLSLLNIPYDQWYRQLPISLEETFESAGLAPSAFVLLLIKDEAIDPFIQEHPILLQKRCVHFSGSVVSQWAIGAHPLMTFGSQLYTLETYQKVPWVLERTGPCFSTLFPQLPNPSWSIERPQKPYYHALCVMANNFTTLLWQKLFDEMERRFQIPNAALQPFLERTVHNIKKNPRGALTGPLVRREKETIEKHLLALESDVFKPVYQAFVAAYEQERMKEEGKHDPSRSLEESEE